MVGTLLAPRANIPETLEVHVLVSAGVLTACVGPGIWLPGMSGEASLQSASTSQYSVGRRSRPELMTEQPHFEVLLDHNFPVSMLQ